MSLYTYPAGAVAIAGVSSEAKQDEMIVLLTAKTPVDFLDAGVFDSSSTNITASGVSVVASLAADSTEIEIIEDIGEPMTITDGSDVVLAYLPLGGGRVKVSISAATVIKIASVSGSTISLGKISINFLG